jgi:hypothetical protein
MQPWSGGGMREPVLRRQLGFLTSGCLDGAADSAAGFGSAKATPPTASIKDKTIDLLIMSFSCSDAVKTRTSRI